MLGDSFSPQLRRALLAGSCLVSGGFVEKQVCDPPREERRTVSENGKRVEHDSLGRRGRMPEGGRVWIRGVARLYLEDDHD